MIWLNPIKIPRHVRYACRARQTRAVTYARAQTPLLIRPNCRRHRAENDQDSGKRSMFDSHTDHANTRNVKPRWLTSVRLRALRWQEDELRQRHFPGLVDRIVRVLHQAFDFFLRHYGRRLKFLVETALPLEFRHLFRKPFASALSSWTLIGSLPVEQRGLLCVWSLLLQ